MTKWRGAPNREAIPMGCFYILCAIPCFVIFMGLLGFAIDGIKRLNRPTPDQLYGCTVQQQAPNGECR